MTQVIYILFGLHILLAIVYAMDFRYDRGSMHNTLLRFVVCFFIPIFGFAFMWFSDYYEKRMKLVKGRKQNFTSEKASELELLNPLDLEDETNKVPMVDALQMDYSQRRKAVVDTLKEDAMDYIGVLKEALLNEDSETSHYASSVIMDIQNRMQTAIFKKEERFQTKPDDMENTLSFEAELYRVIKSGIYEKRDLHKYYVKYKVVSDYLLKEEDPKEACLHDRIEIDFDLGDIAHAGELCERYKKAYPSSETMVVDYIRYYVMLKDREGLNRFFEQLKTLPVLLTSKSLQYIRFFEREGR